jgi:hypothetical protein
VGLRATFEELLLELSLCDFNFDSLVDLLGMSSFVVGVVFDGGGEEGVDEGGLAQSRFTSDLVVLEMLVTAI